MNVPLIEATSISKSFGDTSPIHALQDASLTVDGGEMVAIVGSSGSGKSTLLNILGLLETATGGTLTLKGVEVSGMTERERTLIRSRTVGFVFQAFHLVPYLSCLRNVMLPLIHQRYPRRQRMMLAEASLHRVGLTHRLNAMPTTLSGGEQQRVAVARATVHAPQLLLCDEPTGNLDSENTAAILDLLRELVTPDQAVVVVTHESTVSSRADRVIEVHDGRTR